MAAAIEAAIPGSSVELIEGGRGAFIVTADGARVWDKHKDGGFPVERDLVDKLTRR